jgi:hypothetical protein
MAYIWEEGSRFKPPKGHKKRENCDIIDDVFKKLFVVSLLHFELKIKNYTNIIIIILIGVGSFVNYAVFIFL